MSFPPMHGMNLGAPTDTCTDFAFIDHWQLRRRADSSPGTADQFGEHLSGTNNYAVTFWPGTHSYDIITSGHIKRLGLTGLVGPQAINIAASELPQTTTVSIARPTSLGAQVSITGDGPVRIAIVPTELRALYDAGERINPRFIDTIRGFSPLRMMDYNATNGHSASEGRARLDQPHQNGMMAVEYQARICSQAGSDLWLNIRHGCDGGYVKDIVQAAHANLAPGLCIYLEYSNEIWNTDGPFKPQSSWLNSTASAAYQIAALPAKSQAAALSAGLRRMYGMLAGNMAIAARQVAGPERIRVVLCWQAGSASIWSDMVQGWDAAKAPRDMLEAFAISSYPGPQLSDSAQWLAWAKAGDTASALAFMRKRLAISASYFAAIAAAAKSFGVRWGNYESNAAYLRTAAPMFNDVDRPTAIAFNDALAHSDAGAQLSRELHAAQVASGAAFDIHYNSFGKGSQYGMSGMLGPNSIDGITYPAGKLMAADNAMAWAARARGGWLPPSRD